MKRVQLTRLQRYYQQPVVRQRKRANGRRYAERDRQAVLDLLGRKCALCGCEEERWLTIDHIHGGGVQDYKNRNVGCVRRDILKNPDAKKKYRTLCFNCNCSRHLFASDRALKIAIRREHKRIGVHSE